MLTKEELLAPRYKCIAEDTSGNLRKDAILLYDSGEDEEDIGVFWIGAKAFTDEELKRYPHLFQPLPWYADRKEGEMPGFVKYHDNSFMFPQIRVCKGSEAPFASDGFDASNFEPATEQEYLDYATGN